MRLTPREQQIIQLVRDGIVATKEMAFRLGIHNSSLKAYLSQLYAKLRDCDYQIGSLSELVVWCFKPEVLVRK